MVRISTGLTWVLVIASKIRREKQSVLPAVFLCLLFVSFSPSSFGTVYLTSDEFLTRAFDQKPKPNNLWLKEDHQSIAKQLLGHPYRGLRLRYWLHGNRSAWILDEIGKEAPITIGVVVSNNAIEQVQILTYRESRGGEVRHPFFTNQFSGLSLKQNQRLSGRVDGISGATLSVRAVKNISRFALHLHSLVVGDASA